MEFVPYWNPSILVRQNRPIPRLWALGRADGHKFENFKNSVSQMISIKKGVRETLTSSALVARSQFLLCLKCKKAGVSGLEPGGIRQRRTGTNRCATQPPAAQW